METGYNKFKKELLNSQGHSRKDVDKQISQWLSDIPKVNPQPYQPPPIKATLSQIAPPTLKDGFTPIQEARALFLDKNPLVEYKNGTYIDKTQYPPVNINDYFGWQKIANAGLEKWFEYLKKSLNEIELRCKDRVILPKPPMRTPYGNSFMPQEIIQWMGSDQWAPSLLEKINCIENYYTKCREFEIEKWFEDI